MFGRRLITKKEVTKMNRRKFLLRSTVAAAASASLPALASTTERFSTKQRPVDTMNRIEGWTQGKVKPVKVRNLMIGEGRPKIFAPTTDKTIRLSSGSNPQVSFSVRFLPRSQVCIRDAFAMPGNSAGRSYVLAMARCVRDAGAAFRLNSQVVGFERISSGGWIVNVKESAGGKTTSKTYVAKSLVIASGGFTADRKRCARIDPRLTAEVHTTANPYGTVWDGATSEILDAAQAVGAAVTDGFGLQLLPFWGGRLLDYDGGDIYVNAAGERFVNESLPWKVITDKMLDLEDRSCWVITDARSHKGAMLGLKLINGIVYNLIYQMV